MNEILKKRIEEAADGYSVEITPACRNGYFERYQTADAFEAGAEYAISHQWISVEDELPECSVMMFVKDKYGNYDIAYLSKKGYWIANDGREIVVSFWMPIPKFETKK